MITRSDSRGSRFAVTVAAAGLVVLAGTGCAGTTLAGSTLGAARIVRVGSTWITSAQLRTEVLGMISSPAQRDGFERAGWLTRQGGRFVAQPPLVAAALTHLVTANVTAADLDRRHVDVANLAAVAVSRDPDDVAGLDDQFASSYRQTLRSRQRAASVFLYLAVGGRSEAVARSYLRTHRTRFEQRCFFQVITSTRSAAERARTELLRGTGPAAVVAGLPAAVVEPGTRDIGCVSRSTPIPSALRRVLVAVGPHDPSPVTTGDGAFRVYSLERRVDSYAALRTPVVNAVAQQALVAAAAVVGVGTIAPHFGSFDRATMTMTAGTAAVSIG